MSLNAIPIINLLLNLLRGTKAGESRLAFRQYVASKRAGFREMPVKTLFPLSEAFFEELRAECAKTEQCLHFWKVKKLPPQQNLWVNSSGSGSLPNV